MARLPQNEPVDYTTDRVVKDKDALAWRADNNRGHGLNGKMQPYNTEAVHRAKYMY